MRKDQKRLFYVRSANATINLNDKLFYNDFPVFFPQKFNKQQIFSKINPELVPDIKNSGLFIFSFIVDKNNTIIKRHTSIRLKSINHTKLFFINTL